jgi:hypothetical protein
MAVSILFNMINVLEQTTNSAVSVGEVVQSGWSAHRKQNEGQGAIVGIANTLSFFSNISDNDFIDAPISDNDITPTAQGQAL